MVVAYFGRSEWGGYRNGGARTYQLDFRELVIAEHHLANLGWHVVLVNEINSSKTDTTLGVPLLKHLGRWGALQDVSMLLMESHRPRWKEGSDAVWWLSVVLAFCRAATCRDPRDKIYSVVGILSRMFPGTTVSKLIMPNYEISPYELFTRVTRLILEHSTSLDYISDVRKRSSTAAARELPSWVVDYSFDRESSSMANLYTAFGAGLCDNSKYPRFTVSLTTINCYGGGF